MRAIKLALATVACAVIAAPADAAEMLKFKLTGDLDENWIAPRHPTPDYYDISANLFVIRVYLEQSQREANLISYSAGGGIRLRVLDEILFDSLGDMIFTGPESSPKFRTGVFRMVAMFPDLPGEPYVLPGDGVLTISPIPEPANWALMIAGFGLVGSALRRRILTTT